jgi:hypothetical protein
MSDIKRILELKNAVNENKMAVTITDDTKTKARRKPKKVVEEEPKIIGWNPYTFNPVYENKAEVNKNVEYISLNEWRHIFGSSGSVFLQSASVYPPAPPAPRPPSGSHSLDDHGSYYMDTYGSYYVSKGKEDSLKKRMEYIHEMAKTRTMPPEIAYPEPSITFELDITVSPQLMKGVTAFMDGKTTFYEWLNTI